MIRVLVANIPLPRNRFLVDLNEALGELCELDHDSNLFWEMKGHYDVVHLHFPEYMTYEIERAYNTELNDALIEAITQRLRYWADRARIVVTRHVLLPHSARNDPRWERLYETVYAHADGVVHFADPSVREFRERYAQTSFYRGRSPAHAVIPHQNYASLPSGIGRATARAKLRIPSSAHVMLVFGAIRNRAEAELTLQTFSAVRNEGAYANSAVLVASRWREEVPAIGWIRLQRWIRNIRRVYYRLRPEYRFNYGFVTDEETQIYLEAADVLFIPRRLVLNSGNIALGMTFGRVVVGPDSFDVGEILRVTGNPVFDPEFPETAADAVREGFRLAEEGSVGESNRRIAMSEWKPSVCAASYVGFFEQLIDAGIAA